MFKRFKYAIDVLFAFHLAEQYIHFFFQIFSRLLGNKLLNTNRFIAPTAGEDRERPWSLRIVDGVDECLWSRYLALSIQFLFALKES